MSDVTAPGSRRLLRRVKLVMSGEGTAAQRLDALVEAIANELLCEVCTVYVLRAGEVLELFATQGLNRLLTRKPGPLYQMACIGMSILGQLPAKQLLSDLAMGGKLASAPLLSGKLRRSDSR